MFTRKSALITGSAVVLSSALLIAVSTRNASSPAFSSSAGTEPHWMNHRPLSVTSVESPQPVRHAPTRTPVVTPLLPPPENHPVSAVTPPFPGYEKPMQFFEIDADAGGSFTYETGSKVIIPAHALLHADGTPVSGRVQIGYREYHTVADIFLSGIPMKYDVNGEECYFESAGMLEIRARQHGEELVLDKSRPITARMNTDNVTPDFNLYALNDQTGEWIERGKPEIQVTKPIPGVIESYRFYREPDYSYRMEVVPNHRLPSDKTYRKKVMLAFHSGRSQDSRDNKNEMRWFAGRRFEVLDMKRRDFRRLMKEKFNARVKFHSLGRPVLMDDLLLSDAGEGDLLTMRLERDGEEVEFTVKVDKTSGKQVDRYMNKYLKTREKSHQLQKLSHPQITSTSCYSLDTLDFVGTPGGADTWNFIQEFTMDGFGFWNSDQPRKLPDGANVNASFVADGQQLWPLDVQLVQYGKNAVFMYHGPSYANFRLNPKADNLIWMMVGNDQVACILPEDVRRLDLSVPDVAIPLKIYSVKDFKILLEQIPVQLAS